MKRFISHASTNFLFLFLALYGGIFSISITFSLSEQLGFLFALVICSAAGCALICSLPKKAARRGLALFAVLTLLFLLWYRFDQVFIGAQAVFHKISYLYHQIVPAIPYYTLPENLTLSAVSGEINWFFGLSIPFFALLMGYFFCSSQWILWPVLLVSAILPGVGLVVLLEPPLLPALALVLFLGLWLLAGSAFRSDPDLGIRRTWIALVPLGLVMALLVAIVPPSRYVRSPRADALRAAIMDRVGNWGLSLRTGGASSAAIQDFANAGPLEFDGHTVLTVEGASQGTLLLRGFSAGVYGESSWHGLSPEAYATLSVPPEADFPFTLPTRGTDNAEAVTTAVVRLVTPSSAFLYTPYQLAALPSSVTGTSFYQDSYISRASAVRGWRVSYYPDLLPQAVSLTSSSAQWEIAYRGWVYQNYTTVPARVSQDALRPPQLQGLSALTTAGGRIDAARRVTNYLAQTVRYDQQTPVTPQGEDFVTYFLTKSRRGYCLHYASAATLMLRAMGIPTRFVSGYMAYVPYDGAAVAIPDANAHAWVEIYLDGYGWYPVDVTSGFSGSTDTVFEPEASPSPSAAASPTPSPSAEPTPTPTPAPSRTPSGNPPSDPTVTHFAIPWRPILTGLASFAAVLALIWLQRKLRLLRWRRAMAHPDPNRAALSAYRYLSALARRGNIPTDPQAEALAQKAAFSQHTLVPEEVQAMRDLTQATIKAARAHGSLPHRLMLRYFWALV